MALKKEMERVPYELPMKLKVDKRSEVIEMYASIIWRLADDKLLEQLDALYELAYSNGIKDNEKVHVKIDRLTKV